MNYTLQGVGSFINLFEACVEPLFRLALWCDWTLQVLDSGFKRGQLGSHVLHILRTIHGSYEIV